MLPLLPILSLFGNSLIEHWPRLDLSLTEGKGQFIEEVSRENPRAYLVHNLLTLEQCEEIRDMSSGRLASPSTVGGEGSESVKTEVRRAVTTPLGYLPWAKDSVHTHLHDYVNETFGFDYTHVEMLFVNRYDPGGFYKMHYDGRQRTVTMLLYLNDVEKGGGTTFPRASPAPLMIHPRAGMALVWYNVYENGTIDKTALHAGESVKDAGTKWVANLWIHDKPVHEWPLSWVQDVTALMTFMGLSEMELIGIMLVLAFAMDSTLRSLVEPFDPELDPEKAVAAVTGQSGRSSGGGRRKNEPNDRGIRRKTKKTN
jgi:prolyl 4-hydroxylase